MPWFSLFKFTIILITRFHLETSFTRESWQVYYDCIVFSGLEQSKVRGDEADKDVDNEDGSSTKDQLIRRRFPAMLGQAISVVGGYKDKAPEAAPSIKKLPEPILPVAQTKWAHSRASIAPLLPQHGSDLNSTSVTCDCCRTAGPSGRKKVFRLSDVVQPLSDMQIETMTSKAIKRILHSEKAIAQSGMSHVRTGLCSSEQSTLQHTFWVACQLVLTSTIIK